MKFKFSSIAIALVILTCCLIDLDLKSWKKQERVIESDIHWYYAYLPATIIYGDIQLKNDYRYGDNLYWIWVVHTADGKKIIKTTMGLSFMYAPFFLAAHAFAFLTDFPQDGFSEPYKLFLLLSTIFYLLLGLDILRKVLSHFQFTDKQIGITILLLGLGTNLLCYASQSAPMPHIYNFCLFALFIYFTIKWHAKPSIKNTIITGLLLGLISLIRPSNIIVFVFFALYNIGSWNDLKQRLHFFKKECFLLNLMALMALLVWVPQFIYWKIVTGNYICYSYTDENFFFAHPKIMEGLFSFRKGWLIYTPMMGFAILGIFFLKDSLKKLRVPIILFLVLNIYIIFSWWCWWYGGTYGQRSMIDSYAIMALPLASFVKFISERKLFLQLPFYFIWAFFTWLNIFQTYQFENHSLHWDGMTKELYFKQFGKMKKIKEFDEMVNWPNYEEAKLGGKTDTNQPDKSTVPLTLDKRIIDQKKIHLQAMNGKFLCVDAAAEHVIVANKEKASLWETIMLIQFENNQYALRDFDDHFFSVEINQKNELTSNRVVVGEWEVFSMVILRDEKVAFKAVNGKYLSVDPATNKISAMAATIGENEKFKIVAE